MSIGKVLIRAVIVSFWVALFFVFVSIPHFIHPFKEKTPVLNIFSWPEVLSPEIISRFENASGIKIQRHYYTSNEELLVKLKATKGVGYDLIIPSDYMVKKLIEEDLLQPIESKKLNFTMHLNPRLTRQPFDPENTYSIPYIWEVIGFGINTEQYRDTPFIPKWEHIYSPISPNTKISMINDPIEAIDCTARHLFGSSREIGPKEMAQICATLKKQKGHVEAYAGVRGDYFLITKNCSIAVIPSSYALRAAKNYKHVDFIIPEKYTFLSIENYCIPKSSQNSALAYTFLNYLYQPEILASDANACHNLPATTNVAPYINNSPVYLRTLKTLENYEGDLHYTRSILSETDLRTLWIQIKAG